VGEVEEHHNMAIDISGIFVFMPVFSFLLIFLVVYSVLAKTTVLGESGWINIFISFTMAIIFLSFSSLELYVLTIVPWAIVLLISTFLILLIGGFASGKLEIIMNKGFGWVIVGFLIAIFLIAAIYVFNPVFHPDLIIASGEGTSFARQIFSGDNGRVFGTILLIIIAAVVSLVLAKSK